MPLLEIEFAALRQDGTTDHVLTTLSLDVGSNPTNPLKQPVVPRNPLGFSTLITLKADLAIEAAIGGAPNPFLSGAIRRLEPGASIAFIAAAGDRITAVAGVAKATAARPVASAFVTGTAANQVLNITMPLAALGRSSLSDSDLSAILAAISGALGASAPSGTQAGGGAQNTADFSDPNNAYLISTGN